MAKKKERKQQNPESRFLDIFPNLHYLTLIEFLDVLQYIAEQHAVNISNGRVETIQGKIEAIDAWLSNHADRKEAWGREEFENAYVGKYESDIEFVKAQIADEVSASAFNRLVIDWPKTAHYWMEDFWEYNNHYFLYV